MVINKNIFSDNSGNELRLSSIIQTEQKVPFQNFSAKYVASGNEVYTLNNKKFVVKQGEYVIGNKNTTSSVLIDNTSPVNGICIDIAKEMITDIIDFQYQKTTAFSDFLFEQEWMVQKYNANNTSFGYALQQLSNEFENLRNEKTTVSKELFYAVAECIVKDQSQIFKGFNALKSVKQETNGRLFNFIYEAKNYMDDCFLEKINIELIAQEAKLSEYHFIRLFKTVFNITPYQYIIQQRLAYAQNLLLQKYSLSEIALLTSFADSASFCKAFKLKYGCTPKQFTSIN
ncbi:helix-turn-helix domain-containing protein [Flavobacterium sedimenticola]|uniref:AraC family transcriptional regulator n=1 Tax=Flavobacterium sedimenticola TaxID=3043286 RepID=A0ABT6XSB9_9FLAO|nr:AraC family transcriptional regulator [Flavobacterium sedimenticola]MDI9257961.1 AraC family transcriptional regulator [Flavobacterium sedimenticola]